MDENALTQETEGIEEEVDVNETESQEPGKEKTPPWMQQKIDKLTRLRKEAEEKADSEAKEREKLSAEVEMLKSRRPTEGKPRIDDFDSDEEFYDALTDWKFEQREEKSREAESVAKKEAEAANQADKNRRAQQTFQENVGEVNTKGSEKYEDYEQTINSIPSGIMTVELASLIFETDSPEDVAYHLAKNPKEAAKISKLSPSKKAVALGRIEARLSTKKTTTAPPPIDPVKTSGESFDAEKLLEKNPSKWMELRNKGEI